VTRARRKKSDANARERGDQKVFAEKTALLALAGVQKRHGVGLSRLALNLRTEKRQKCVLRPARQQACLQQGSYAVLQEAVGVVKVRVGWLAAP